MLDRLVGSELQANLGSAGIGREIIVLEQTDSTNDAILKVATADSNEGLVLLAEHQTTGRGQRGNRWESEIGRASCRERVEIWGVAGGVKEKKESSKRTRAINRKR